MTTTAAVRTAVLGATEPAQVFGPASGDPAAVREARRTYRLYAGLLHPDHAGDPAAFGRLAELYRQWQEASGSSGSGAPVVVTGRVDTYPIGDVLAQGSVATLFRSSGVVLKVARRPVGNRFLANERAAYWALGPTVATHTWLRPYYPRLVDVAALAGPDGQIRQVNVLAALTDGFVTLADVRRALPQGLDGRDWAWMYRRLLRAVAGAHLAGLVHGAIVADNVLIHPGRHGVVLAGWSFATSSGARPPGLTRSGADPPEVRPDRPVTDKADVHQLHTLMIAMLNPAEQAQIAYARGCRQDNPRMRPSAAALLDEYDELIGRLYGRRRFRPFTIPTPAV
jgi:hypothetical protein